MEPPLYGTEKEYMECLLKLVNASSDFLDSIRDRKIKFVSAKSGRIDDIADTIATAELKFVKELEHAVTEMNNELSKLTAKFQIIKKNYREDSSLRHILGDYNKSPADAYKKLQKFMDASLSQIDSVITSYSRIDKEKNQAKKWITTVLSHYSTPQAVEKARNSNRVMKELESLVEEVREVCYDTKLTLLGVRSKANKYSAKREIDLGF